MRDAYKIIRLWDLPNELRICLDKCFTDKIFTFLLNIYKTQKSLANVLNTTQRRISYWWRKNGSIPSDTMLKIVDILNRNHSRITIYNIERNVVAISATGKRSSMGVKSIPFKLPFIVNESIVRITELLRTDGYVQSNLNRVRFKNKNYGLIEDFKNTAIKVFGKDRVSVMSYNDGSWEVNITGKPLAIFISKLFYIQPGDKSLLIYIPEIIKKSPLSVKRVALQSYFDAEGTVNKSIFLIALKSYSLRFLNNVKNMLMGFGIESRIDKKYKDIIITHKNNIMKFYEEIGFSQSYKKLRLQNFVDKYNRIKYYTKKEVEGKIVETLENANKKWVQLKFLETKLKRDNSTIHRYISNLVKAGIIEKRLVRQGNIKICEIKLT